MEIKDWPPDNVGDLVGMYNAQVAGYVPHCFEVSPAEFDAGRYQETGDDYQSNFSVEHVVVGLQDGKTRGFAHIRVGEVKHRDKLLSGGYIHFLTYAAGYREIGQAILSECEKHFNDVGVKEIRVFDGYFYRFHHLGFPLVSDRMAHIYGLLGMNGYKLAGEGEIFFESQNFSLAKPVPPDNAVDVQVQILEGRGDFPNIKVQALSEGTEIGSCVALSVGDFCNAREAQDRIFVDGLGVMGIKQGQGWGRYLLIRTLWEAHLLGYRHSIISTGRSNFRAQLFYTNYGYRVTDTVYGFKRKSVNQT
jgi:GNAT superfamily N-acetyltransferase